MLLEAALVDEPEPARVDELDRVALVAEHGRDAVARGARGRVDDGDAALQEPVEEGGLPDVRAADDGDEGEGHDA